MAALAALAVAALAWPPGAAAAPGDLGVTMVTDLDTAPGAGGVSKPLVRLGSILLFPGDDGSTGGELWRSDGTVAGTVLVKDINPGTDEDPPDADSSDPNRLVAAGGFVYFTAEDGDTGRELWRSDGTAAGTTLVKDINPGNDDDPPDPDSSNIDEITAVGATVLFRADDGTNGTELWKSDGTGPGTQIVNGPDGINPGSGAGSQPSGMTALGTTVFFGADGGTDGSEPWKSDPPYSTATQVAR